MTVTIDRELGAAHITVRAPGGDEPTTADELLAAGAAAWVLAAARQLDDAILRLRFNEPEVGTWVLHTAGDPARCSPPRSCCAHDEHWLVNEVRLLLDAHAQATRSVGAHARRARRAGQLLRRRCWPSWCSPPTVRSCSTGRTPTATSPPATLRLTEANDGWFPMANGLSRLATRFWGRDDQLDDGCAAGWARTCSPPRPATSGW